MNSTWIYENVIDPYFGLKVTNKEAGFNMIVYVILPVALISLYITLKLLFCILRCVVKCLKRVLCCCCNKKKEEKVKTA